MVKMGGRGGLHPEKLFTFLFSRMSENVYMGNELGIPILVHPVALPLIVG